MDVPTRQSYVAALVKPAERTFTSGVTNLARNVFWAVGSATAGVAMQVFGFSTPLFIGGGAKIADDVVLYKSFRRLKPPEETMRASGWFSPLPGTWDRKRRVGQPKRNPATRACGPRPPDR